MTKLMGLFFIFFSSNLFAEYRVYQYLIQDNKVGNNSSDSKIITSSLDPVSFKAYHGGDLLKLDLLRTWICPGYTGEKQSYCKSPYEKLEEEMDGL